MQFAAGELEFDGFHHQALALDWRQSLENSADDQRLEMTAVAGNADLDIRDAVTNALRDCFGFQDKTPLFGEML